MIDQLRRDLTQAPEAFDLVGPTDTDVIDRVLAELGHPAAESLRDLWSAIGGGDMFETEEVLGPAVPGDHSLAGRNAELRRGGLPAQFLAFHVGLHVSATDASGSLFALDPDTLQVIRRYDSLADWYDDLRREYAGTYGLADAPS